MRPGKYHSLWQEWNSVASSADGTKLVAVVNSGYVYTSVDSGTTWTQRGTQQNWGSVASSADGTMLVAIAFGQVSPDGSLVGSGIYTSDDSGTTWTDRQ